MHYNAGSLGSRTQPWSNMPLDYIICGSESEIKKWAKYAHELGIVACAEEKFSSACCSHFGCGISDGELGIQVVRFDNAEDFIGIRREAAIMLTRKSSARTVRRRRKGPSNGRGACSRVWTQHMSNVTNLLQMASGSNLNLTHWDRSQAA